MSKDGTDNTQPESDTEQITELEPNIVRGFMIGFGAFLGVRSAEMNNILGQKNIFSRMLSSINSLLRPKDRGFSPAVDLSAPQYIPLMHAILCDIYEIYRQCKPGIRRIAYTVDTDPFISEDEVFDFLRIGLLCLDSMRELFPELNSLYDECNNYLVYLIVPGEECKTKIIKPVLAELQPKLVSFKYTLFNNKIVIDISNINSSQLVDYSSLEDLVNDIETKITVVIGKFDFSMSHYMALMSIFNILAKCSIHKLDVLCLETSFDASMMCALAARAKFLHLGSISIMHSQSNILHYRKNKDAIHVLRMQLAIQERALSQSKYLTSILHRANTQKPTIMDGS